MKAHEALIAWTPAQFTDEPRCGQVMVGPILPDYDWTETFAYTGGAAFIARRMMRGAESIAQLFVDFHTLVVRDGIDPKAAHREFLKIEEYAQSISPDIPPACESAEKPRNTNAREARGSARLH